jgi:hypothetical protein
MKNKSYCERALRISRAALVLLGIALAVPVARATSPDWLRQAAAVPPGTYPDEVNAVLIYDEQITTVKDNGEITTLYRRAYRILRPAGHEHELLKVGFDGETKITSLKAWCLPAQGKEYEVKDREAVETSLFNDSFFSDDRQKVVVIPAADPGNVIGYEYEQKQRPYVLEDLWRFQHADPSRLSRFTLTLPKGWEYKAYWRNHPEVQPRSSGENTWTWELHDIPALQYEYAMPASYALAGRLNIIYYPSSSALADKSLASWAAVGSWYAKLAAGRADPSPEEKQKVLELTSALPAPLDKMRALAAFMQHQIRYVDVEVGIGGWQPHAAPDVFHNRYGDCKDKATLLSSMLKVAGIDSYPMLVNVERGVVSKDVPLAMTFNHVILAIQLPSGVPTDTLYATAQDAKLGKLLIFDPTAELIPFGILPAEEQGNRALLVGPDGGRLIDLPLLPAKLNQLSRTAKFTLSSDGGLTGEVQETLTGELAAERRAALMRADAADRRKVMERYLGGFLSGFSLGDLQVDNLDKYDQDLVIHYRFSVQRYAKPMGALLLVRPRVLGQKADAYFGSKPRQQPVEFDALTLQTDVFEISLPPGFSVDDLPAAADVDAGFASYKSHAEVKDNVLRYSRQYEVKDILVPMEKLDALKKFNSRIAYDENASAVLKTTH